MRFLVTIFVLIGFIACKKPTTKTTITCPEQPTFYINSEISEFKFKMGTYWVFIDSVSSQIDTMKITNIDFDGLVSNSDCANQLHEYYAFTVNKKYDDVIPNVYDAYSLQGSALMLNQTDEAGNNFLYVSNSSKMDSLFVYDRYYKSVIKARRTNVTLYYNTAYGLLKIENGSGKKLLKDKFIVR